MSKVRAFTHRFMNVFLALSLASSVTLVMAQVYVTKGSSSAAAGGGFKSFTVRSDATNYTPTAASMAGASVQEIDSNFRFRGKFDLTGLTEGRVVVMQSSGAGVSGRIAVQYSTAANCSSMTDSGVFAALGTINTLQVGTWTSLPTVMRADVCIRVVATNGDGTEAPQVANIYFQAR